METFDGNDGVLKINGEAVAEVKSWKLSSGDFQEYESAEPRIYAVRDGGLFRRPVLWLMMPCIDEPWCSFQIGEFRDRRSAEIARNRLSLELIDRAQAARNEGDKRGDDE